MGKRRSRSREREERSGCEKENNKNKKDLNAVNKLKEQINDMYKKNICKVSHLGENQIYDCKKEESKELFMKNTLDVSVIIRFPPLAPPSPLNPGEMHFSSLTSPPESVGGLSQCYYPTKTLS